MDTHTEQVKRMSARPIVRHYRDSTFVTNNRLLPPCPMLAPFVEGLLCTQFIGSIAASYHLYRLPEANPWLVAAMGPRRACVLVTGPHTHIDIDCIPPWTTAVCGVMFCAGALGPLFGIPASELTDASVDLEDLISAAGRHLRHRLEDARCPNERLVILEQFLVDLMRTANTPSAPVGVAITNSLARRAPVRRLSELEDIAGWSQRHLRRLFLRDIGLAPKRYLRLLRFSKLVEHLRQTHVPRWDDLSLALGYSDQAHLITEFRSFVGVSPTKFLAEPTADTALRQGDLLRPRQDLDVPPD